MRYPPGRRIYLVMDNLSTHWTADIRAWASQQRRTGPDPTYASFLNRIECHSPLWDVHPAAWAGPAGPVQRDWNDVEGLVAKGRITGPGGAPFGPAGFIVDCPIVSRAG